MAAIQIDEVLDTAPEPMDLTTTLDLDDSSQPSDPLGSESTRETPQASTSLRSKLKATKGVANTIISFREAKISIAVDVSGSTHGKVIEAEQRAINGVATLLPPNLQHQIDILPWSDVAGGLISIEDMDDLDSWGGTDPNSILQNSTYLRSLHTSSFWFLMTDGEIKEADVRIFARNLLDANMHGKACVTCIFGQTQQKPADCDVTIGLSVFAICPHTAFLFTDVDSGRTYVLQTKGCFNSLLPPNTSNPTLDYETTWEDLPRTSFENLSRVSIVAPQQVEREEVILQDNVRINLDELFSNSAPDEETIGQLLENEDNLKSVTLTAKIRGKSAGMDAWLNNVEEQKKASSPSPTEPTYAKSQFVSDVMARMENSTDGKDVSAAEKRRGLDMACSNAPQPFLLPLVSQHHRRVSSLSWARRVSDGPTRRASDNIGSWEIPPTRQTSLATPGFQTSAESDANYFSKCVGCGLNHQI